MALYIRSRDVRTIIKDRGFEMGTVEILERMCEEQVGTRQVLMDMMSLVKQCIDNVANMTKVGETLALQLDEVKRREEQFNQLQDGNG